MVKSIQATLIWHRLSRKETDLLFYYQPLTDLSNDNDGRPEIVRDYNSSKGGVDSVDNICHAYTVRLKCNRSSMMTSGNVSACFEHNGIECICNLGRDDSKLEI